MTFEVFSYWNMHELQLVFNAIAAITASGDYLGLLRTIALVGMISIAMAALAGFSQPTDFMRWVIMLAIFNGMLLVPKVNVVLTDRTGTQGQITVANVPLGLAAFANSVSHIGDWLTRTYETTFTVIPNDLTFSTHGALWGQRVQKEMLHSQFANSVLQTNLLDFYRECVVPEFATGYVVASDMAKAQDIWAYLSGKTNPGRFVTVRAMTGSPVVAGTYTCDVGYGLLTNQITVDTTNQISGLASRLFPTQPNATANAAMTSAIQTSTNYILGISMTAADAVKQTAMTNFMIDAQYNLPAQIGDAAGAAANLAQAQAIRSTSDSYKLMAKLAESTMPKVKNIVEIVQYSVFPIILLMVLLAGHKGGLVLKAYVMSLFWVQLWPPLYAVMHMIMTLHAQELATMTAGQGLSMSDYSLLNNAYISDEAIAGMIAATAIPSIAAAIVKGGDMGAQAIAGMVSPSREAEKVASGMATGNIQMGNVSLGNQSADNLSQGQYNAKPTLSQGGMVTTGADGVVHRYGQGGRSEVVDNSAAMQKIGADLKLEGRTAGALQKASTDSEKAALTETNQSSNSMTAARDTFSTFDRGHGKTKNASTGDTVTGATQFLQSYGNEKTVADNWLKQNGLTGAQAAAVEAYARAEVSGGINVPLVGGVNASAGTTARASSSSTSTQAATLGHQLAQNQAYRAAVSNTNTAAHSSSFTQGDESSVRAAKGVRASLNESMGHVQTAQANHEKSLAYQETAQRTKEQGAGFSITHNNEFMDWMRGQNNPQTRQNYTASDVEQMARFEPERLGDFAQKFTDQKLVPEIEKNMPVPTNNVAAQNAENQNLIPGTAAVQAFNAGNQVGVLQQQNAAGVNPDKEPVNTVAPTVQAMHQQGTTEINQGKQAVDEKGQPIQAKVENDTDPSKGSNAARAAVNAIPSVLGSDSTKLLDRVGAIPAGADAAQKVADENKGTLTENIVGAVVEVGLTVGGGALGKGGGKAAEGVLELGGKAGNAAEMTTRRVDELAQARLAENTAAKGDGAATHAMTPEATKASADAETARLAALEKKVANDGAKAQVETEKTAKGSGQVAGMVAGAGVGSLITGHDGIGARGDAVLNKAIEGGNEVKPVIQSAVAQLETAGDTALAAVSPVIQQGVAAVKETNDAVLNTASDLGNKANELGNQVINAVALNQAPDKDRR